MTLISMEGTTDFGFESPQADRKLSAVAAAAVIAA